MGSNLADCDSQAQAQAQAQALLTIDHYAAQS
jgi:hypothetical protein